MAVVGQPFFTPSCVSESTDAILTPTHQVLTVGTKRTANDHFIVCKGQELLIRHHIPQDHRLVFTRRCEELAINGESGTNHRVLVSGKDPNLTTYLQVVQRDGGVLVAATRVILLGRGDGDALHPTRMTHHRVDGEVAKNPIASGHGRLQSPKVQLHRVLIPAQGGDHRECQVRTLGQRRLR